MKQEIVLSARIATIVLLTLPLTGCAGLSFTDITMVLGNLFGGGGQTTVVVCPRYPNPPPAVVDTLEREARADPAFEAWVIDQSQLRDNLESCD